MPTMILSVLPLGDTVSAPARGGIAASSASKASANRPGDCGPLRTIDYCGRGASLRQLWLSPNPEEDDQSPHLSQPASSAPSTIMQATRAARLRQSAFGSARMGNSLVPLIL